jgi:uncharacterized protein YcfJ
MSSSVVAEGAMAMTMGFASVPISTAGAAVGASVGAAVGSTTAVGSAGGVVGSTASVSAATGSVGAVVAAAWQEARSMLTMTNSAKVRYDNRAFFISSPLDILLVCKWARKGDDHANKPLITINHNKKMDGWQVGGCHFPSSE